jgi:hypothetical protein
MALIDHTINPTAAAAFTKTYRDANPGKIIGGYFTRDCFDSILAQTGCAGIRYYYALNTSLEPCIVVTGVDVSGNDLCNGVLIEMSIPCPNMCSTANFLNS